MKEDIFNIDPSKKSNFSRRNFLKGASMLPFSGVLSSMKPLEQKIEQDNAPHTQNLYESMLSQWCEALLKLQIRDIDNPGLLGGILCPAGSRVRGRCFDAILPFMYMAKHTGDSRFLEGAIMLQRWSNHVTVHDGSWLNEPITSDWKGITVFAIIGMGESLYHFGDLLDSKETTIWKNRLA